METGEEKKKTGGTERKGVNPLVKHRGTGQAGKKLEKS